MNTYNIYIIRYHYQYSNYFGWRNPKDYSIEAVKEGVKVEWDCWGAISWLGINHHGGTARGKAKVVAHSEAEAIALLEVEDMMNAMKFTKELQKIEEGVLSVYAYRYHGTCKLNNLGSKKYCQRRDKFLREKTKELVKKYMEGK